MSGLRRSRPQPQTRKTGISNSSINKYQYKYKYGHIYNDINIYYIDLFKQVVLKTLCSHFSVSNELVKLEFLPVCKYWITNNKNWIWMI